MTDSVVRGVPFVDLRWQHQPLQSEILAVVAAGLERGDFVLGEAVTQFEQAFAQASGVAHGVGVASGTDAIALGLRACGLGPDDEVLLPANTFVATLIGVLRAGATPVLVDCDGDTALIDLASAAKAITARTRAIVPVHLYGQMVAPDVLRRFANQYGLLIFEDAAQAHLAQRQGYRAGAVGAAAAFSFYPSKNLGALGDGGMVLTNSAAIAEKMRSLRNYGAARKYYHTEPAGTNSRLDTLQAAVLALKLPHLESWNQARNQLAKRYDHDLQPLADYGIQPIRNQSGSGHVYHLYGVRVRQEACPLSRAALQQALTAAGIQTGIHYPIPCHLQPAFQHLGYDLGDFPQAEQLSHEILSLPMYPGLSQAQVEYVVTTLSTVLAKAISPSMPNSLVL